MKKYLSQIIIVAILALSIGCASTPTTPTPATQTQRDAAIVLQNLARNAAAIAIDEDAGNSKFVQLAVTALDEFAVGESHTPGALSDALAPVIKEVRDIKIRLAIDTVADLYAVFYGRYVKDQLASKEAALLFVRALRDGAAQALEITKPTVTAVEIPIESISKSQTLLGGGTLVYVQ